MCGIAGVFGHFEPGVAKEMIGRLRHRGPDDVFLAAGADFTLTACRLAIIDVIGGRQPLSNEDGTIWATQNGELYNFPDLAPRLREKGHRLHTRTDTEILPHLYEEHGAAFPEALSGMFAVALWDDRNKRGILARDRAGKKPLYWMEHKGALYYASEIKALLSVPGFERRLNSEAIHHFLSYKHVPSPLTAFVGINMLPPAHTLTWQAGSPATVKSYWSLSWSPDPYFDRVSEEEAAERVAATLEAAVKRRLLSDVPVGFYLSGGVDSSLSTAMAARVAGHRIETFTLTYAEDSTTAGKSNDQIFARAVADRYGTEHHEEEIAAPNFAEELPRILRSFDEPFSGVVSPYFLARRIAKHVKVALAGDGADELFGSYLSHRIAPLIADFTSRGESALTAPEAAPVADLVRRIGDPDPAVWRARLFVMDEAAKRALYTAPFARSLGASPTSEAHLASSFQNATAQDPVNRILEGEFRGIFPDQVLAFVDRLSMAHSLETRSAFLDTEFMELAASVPGRLKIRDGDVKVLLKKAAAPYLPADLIRRPKEGFVMPVNQWLGGHLGDYVRSVLTGPLVRDAGILEPDGVRAIHDRFAGGETGLANSVLSILSLHVWWNEYFGDARAF
jgi:asparagine synthase (glutamine-hydrolysing)